MNGDAQNTPTPQGDGQWSNAPQPVQPVTYQPGAQPPQAAPVAPVTVPPVAPQPFADPVAQPIAYQPAAQVQPQPFVAPHDDIPEQVTPYALPEDQEMPIAHVTWTASEFIAHHKTPNWYLKFGGSAVIGSVLVWVVTRDLIAAIVILLMAAIIVYGAGRQPRTLNYALDEHGLYAGEKMYPYDLFKSFSVVHEGPLSSIIFMPIKRWQLATSVYYDPKDEEAIMDALAPHLPMTEYNQDPMERLARKMRF